MRLLNSSNSILVEKLEVADTFWSRTRGLLGRSGLSHDEALWIKRCNSIHTYFMKFPIDLIFLNRKMEVTRTIPNVKPGRLIWPVWSASSVIELASGFLETRPLKIGERVHVDTSLS